LPVGTATFMHRVIGSDRNIYQEIELFQFIYQNE
jgi:hypothetical protein